MAHIEYPNSLDLQGAQFVFQTIKDKTIVENKVKFANSIWGLTGFLLRTVVGVPPHHNQTFGDTQPTSFTHEEEAVLQCVCDECSEMVENPITMTDTDPISGFDIASLIALMPIILQLLQVLGIRFRRKSAGPGPLSGDHPEDAAPPIARGNEPEVG